MAAYGALMLTVSMGQAMVTSPPRWGWLTVIGLGVAWLFGGALITVLDPVFHVAESIAIPIAHAACGLILGGVQASALPGRRVRWTAVSAAAWLIASVAVFSLYNVPRLAGDMRGQFAGSTEMTTLVRLLPIYAVAMLLASPRRRAA